MSCDKVMRDLVVRLGSNDQLFSVYVLTCQACLSYDSLPTVMWHCAVTYWTTIYYFAKRCQKRSFLTLNIGHQFNACSEAKTSIQMFDCAEICSDFPYLSRTHPQPHVTYPTVCPSSIWDHPKDIGPTQNSHIIPAPLHTSTDIGESEGPHPL